jgi:phosphoribosylformylglycinamidine synthase
MATSIGHAPAVALIDAAAGSRVAIAEALTNVVWAPIEGGIRGISLSANWMWPCRNEGEDARLYEAVQAASDFAIRLGVNIPTGKDSLSMTQKYADGEKVLAPGSVLISTVGEVRDIRKAVKPVMKQDPGSVFLYIDLSQKPFALGGSSFAQSLNQMGNEIPDIADPEYFAKAFEVMQGLIEKGWILAGHDISAGGMITTLLEMCFPNVEWGIEADLSILEEPDPVKILLSENPGWIVQIKSSRLVAVHEAFAKAGILAFTIGKPVEKRLVRIFVQGEKYKFDINSLRDKWMRTSYLFDCLQSGEKQAGLRYTNYKNQPLAFDFPQKFSGCFAQYGIDPARTKKTGIKAAIIRDKGINGDREMAFMMHLAGFDVRDVHMTDLISGRETLEDIKLLVFTGGFSNADVLGSAKGWAGSFLYNEKAKKALEKFYARPETMSLGVCNGCQIMMHLGLITPEHEQQPSMEHNLSGKFESCFINVGVEPSPSIMLKSLEGSRLGIWVAHGEGRFNFPYSVSDYKVAVRFSYDAYPANPNGSPEGIAGISSRDGRHLAMMPHPERCIYPWNWAAYPEERINDEVTPWIEMFINAKDWITEKTK